MRQRWIVCRTVIWRRSGKLGRMAKLANEFCFHRLAWILPAARRFTSKLPLRMIGLAKRHFRIRSRSERNTHKCTPFAPRTDNDKNSLSNRVYGISLRTGRPESPRFHPFKLNPICRVRASRYPVWTVQKIMVSPEILGLSNGGWG